MCHIYSMYTGYANTAYSILSNFLLSSLTPYVDEIIGDHHLYWILYNTLTTVHVVCIYQIFEEKCEYR